MPRLRLHQLVERQQREVVEVGVLDMRQVPKEVARCRIAVAPLRGDAALFQRLPPVHPGSEELED
eukprot:11910311-Alexandrium_andersonii.AAC.1